MNFQKNLKRRLKIKKAKPGMANMKPTSASGIKKSLKLRGRAKGMPFGGKKGY